LADVKTKQDWLARRKEARRQLFEMLGLDPLPKRTPLKAVVTGRTSHAEFTVENVQFQSRPGLYVTGNLYLPKKRTGKLPVILYVCGHARVKDRKTGVSYGNKAHYQHHGAWFARNGYACLTIDTLQLGEIEGIHHGTYNHGMWWWNARGYSPAGVEAWNCIRALDYIATRPELDADRIGVTGRSGGGAYSWWVAALDERIKVAVPVAGITSLRNHVVDGCVEGHCDCMYHVNTYRWDFAQVAALVAPRPLLISNSDKDRIFPLDGVIDVYNKTRRIYKLLGAEKNIGLQITEGPHKDTQELRIHAFHWFNRFLKGQSPSPLIELAARKLFDREQLRVFHKLPADQQNTSIHETFTAKAKTPQLPDSKKHWEAQRRIWMQALREKCFRGWPTKNPGPLNVKQAFSVVRHGIRFSAYDFDSQKNIRLRLYLVHRAGVKTSQLKLIMLDALAQKGWEQFVATMKAGFPDELKGVSGKAIDKYGFNLTKGILEMLSGVMVYVAPRGIGPTEWNRNARKRVQYRRRFMLLGQTLDGMRTWDVVRAVKALRSITGMADVPLMMSGEREMAGVTLYASLFVPRVKLLHLSRLEASHRSGPIFLNVLRYLEIPQAVAMAAERSQIHIHESGKKDWMFPVSVAKRLKWNKDQIQFYPSSPPAKSKQ
ncbi:MAG: acetylxylan esterase, partial [Planctomycetes bacterium]|nr:acetylxylan esterase [Planctomycetota bacterium]